MRICIAASIFVSQFVSSYSNSEALLAVRLTEWWYGEALLAVRLTE